MICRSCRNGLGEKSRATIAIPTALWPLPQVSLPWVQNAATDNGAPLETRRQCKTLFTDNGPIGVWIEFHDRRGALFRLRPEIALIDDVHPVDDKSLHAGHPI